jgi:epoxyqueuosine reductase
MSVEQFVAALKLRAAELGCQLCGVAPAARPETLAALHEWLEAGLHSGLSYMERRREAYAHPEHVQRGVKTVVMLGAAYTPPPKEELLAGVDQPRQARIAAYAQGARDYHEVLRERLGVLADMCHAYAPQCRTRLAVDTAPLLERDFARRAGLGWFGKNTLLINKRIGSYFLLAALLTDLELPPDAPQLTQHCGTCTRCLDICPTQALPQPYVLDARRCISTWTIELRDQPIPPELHQQFGEWVFGCDLCQAVCPWNRQAPPTAIADLAPLPQLQSPNLDEWLTAEPAAFTAGIAGTPLERTGREALLRNAQVVLENLRQGESPTSAGPSTAS